MNKHTHELVSIDTQTLASVTGGGFGDWLKKKAHQAADVAKRTLDQVRHHPGGFGGPFRWPIK